MCLFVVKIVLLFPYTWETEREIQEERVRKRYKDIYLQKERERESQRKKFWVRAFINKTARDSESRKKFREREFIYKSARDRWTEANIIRRKYG